MATRRTATTPTQTKLTEPIAVHDSSQDTSSQFTTTSSHFEDSQNSDHSYRESQVDGTQVVNSQGPEIGDELHAILDGPGSADVDMEEHERRSAAPSRAGAATAASSAPRERGDSEYEPSDAGDIEEDDTDGPVSNETLFPHLVYSDDGPRHPTFSFNEIRDAALSGQAALPPNTALFELDNSFQPANLKHVMLLRQGVRNRWKKLGGKQPLKVFPLPAAGRTRHVQVQFSTTEDFTWATELVIYWKKKGYRPAAFGPALGPRYRIFSTQLSPTVPLDEAADAVFTAIPDHLQITTLWGLNSGPENHPEQAEFTGHMVAVIYFPCAAGSEHESVPEEILLTLPGWVRLRGKDYESFYDGRGAWCRLCRGRAEDFHTQDECHHNTCNWCQGKHRTNDCPTNQDTQTSTDDATASQEDPSPTTTKTTATGTTTAGDRPVTPTSTSPDGARVRTPATPRTPSRSTLRNQGITTPGASSSRTLVGDSPSLMDRLSKAPVTPKDHKGKGRQTIISDYLVPKSITKTVPTAATLAPSKRSAPSTGTSASTAHINSRPRPYPANPVLCESPPSAGLRVTTFNCGRGGLRARLADIFSSSHSVFADADIILLQEAHVSPPITIQDSAGLARLLGNHFRPYYKAILTGDAGILILSGTVQPISCSSGSRWAHLQASIRTAGLESAAAINMDLWSIHGPVRPSTFWSDDLGPALAASRLSSPLPDLIVGADWNALPDPTRDSLHGTGASCPWPPIAAILDAHQLGDVDRILRPEERVFSRIVRGPGNSISSAKRLDSIWVSPRLLPLASPARYVDTTSDHRAVSITFDLGQTRPPHLTGHSRPWSRWTLHPGTLRDPTFRRALHDFVTDITPPPGTAFLPNPIPAWADFERRLRSVAQTEARAVGQSHLIARAAARDIELRLERLDLTLPGVGDTLAELTAALLVARQIRLDTAQMSAVDPHLVNVFRPSTWLNRANDTSAVTRISSLLNPSGHGGTTDTHLLETVWSFYQSLYTPHPFSPLRTSHTATLLSMPTNRISTQHTHSLNLPFTHEEISAALSTARNTSAPGPNGLTYPLLKLVAPLAIDLLTHMANGMRDGAPVPVPLRTTLLYKRGPRNDIGNYRPISVSDVHVRVLTRAAAHRLQTALATTLPWHQAAFIPGRRTTSIAGALLGCAEHTYAAYPGYPTSFVAIFLDQQKAYDRVDRSWLWAVLLHFGIPQPFVAFLQSLYSSPTTQVVVNGLLTYLVSLSAGLLQGDPLSCALYNMALQPLLDALSHLQVGIIVPGLGRIGSLAFADDVALLLPLGPEGLHQWTETLRALSLYESASGARLNRSKSGYFVVSRHPTSADPLIQALQAWGIRPLTPTNGELLHLGHPLQLGTPGTPCPLSFADRLAAIGARIKLMETSGTDLLLRVRLCNSLLTPMLWHHTAVGGLPLNAGKLVRQTLRPFLYKGGTAWLDNDVICRPRPSGGLGLIDPDAMFTGQSIGLLAHHLLEDDAQGSWLRLGLAMTLHYSYGSSPAILLLPGSASHARLKKELTRTTGFWGRLLHALCQVRVTIDPAWTQLPVLALLELPWHDPGSLSLVSTDSPLAQDESRRKKILQVVNQGWITWGDVLWRHPSTTPGHSFPDSWPLGPPSPQDTAAHHHPRPGAPSGTKGPQLGQIWKSLWCSSPASVTTSLAKAQFLAFRLPTDQTRARPLLRDASAPHFPWHLLRINDTPPHRVSCRSTRLAQTPSSPYSVAWQLGQADSPAAWATAWKELHAVPLPSAAIASCFLWLHRRAWLARDGTTVAPCPLCDSWQSESQEHAYATCPSIESIWTLALPLLRAMGITDTLQHTPLEIALAWPVVKKHRHRLALWRTAIIHWIASIRSPALSRHANSRDFSFTLPPPHTAATGITTLIAEGIQSDWARIRQRPQLTPGQASQVFDRKWAKSSSFVRRDTDSDTRITFTIPPLPDGPNKKAGPNSPPER